MMRKRYLQISIHTSAREVTPKFVDDCMSLYISIHTSAREVTKQTAKQDSVSCISIHTSAREVTETLTLISFMETISIHTSAREVTLIRNGLSMYGMYFNPHFRKGSDLSDLLFRRLVVKFQSTLPQGK